MYHYLNRESSATLRCKKVEYDLQLERENRVVRLGETRDYQIYLLDKENSLSIMMSKFCHG